MRFDCREFFISIQYTEFLSRLDQSGCRKNEIEYVLFSLQDHTLLKYKEFIFMSLILNLIFNFEFQIWLSTKIPWDLALGSYRYPLRKCWSKSFSDLVCFGGIWFVKSRAILSRSWLANGFSIRSKIKLGKAETAKSIKTHLINRAIIYNFSFSNWRVL